MEKMNPQTIIPRLRNVSIVVKPDSLGMKQRRAGDYLRKVIYINAHLM
jgi:hypothetical protein